MVKKDPIEIIKVPIKKSSTVKIPPFPKMPKLYLELLENKNKIKQDLVNSEYIPEEGEDVEVESEEPKEEIIKEKGKKKDKGEKASKRESESPADSVKSKESNKGSIRETIEKIASTKLIQKSLETPKDKIKESFTPASTPGSKKSDQSDEIANRMKELMEESDRSVRSDNSEKSEKVEEDAPTLSQLQARGQYVGKKVLPDIARTDQEEQDLKRQLLFKFELLKKSYKGADIPNYSMHTEYSTLRDSYENTVHNLSLDSTVENYRKYLIVAFVIIEKVLGDWLNFDMEGYTKHQITSMNSYDKLLIELGEKSYAPGGSKWPVEVRLLFLVVVNTAMFLLFKMIMKKAGDSSLLNLLNPNGVGGGEVKKKKMKGPSVDLDDIPEVEDIV